MEKYVLINQVYEKFQWIARNSDISRKMIPPNCRGSSPNFASDIKRILRN